MRATEFEFRQRFMIISLIIFVGFSLYAIDHQNAAVGLMRAAFGHDFKLDSAQGQFLMRAFFGVATLVEILAALLRTWATAYLHSVVVHDPTLHARQLVADGPYRRVRNPLYLGTLLMTVGLGAMASRIGWPVMVVAMSIFLLRLILREEGEMHLKQGQSFDDYRARVPRMLMSIWPRIPRGNGVPRWGQAFLGESFCWVFALGLCVFVATLNVKYADCIFAVGVLGGLVLRQISHRMSIDRPA